MKKINIILLFVISLFWFGCDPGEELTKVGDPSTCEGCHTSKSTLQQYAEGEASGGTGGG